MATIEQLGKALVNADAAGDVEAAKMLAAEIKRMGQLAALDWAMEFQTDCCAALMLCWAISRQKPQQMRF